MPENASLVEHIQQWMRSQGWAPQSEGPAGTMWVNSQLGGDIRVGVLRDLDASSYHFTDLVSRLSDAHHLPTTEIADTLKNWSIDITYLRAANDQYITDTIPLSAGAAMLEAARLMYRSAATAAVKVRPAINGSFSKLGDAVADQVRMGHTLSGSYVIPVLVKVGEGEEEPKGSLFADTEAHSASETLERRATRTFAQAFAAVYEQIVEPEKAPSASQLHNIVASGVTREFVTAVSRILTSEAVSSLDATFEWAPSQGTPANTPERVMIPSEAAPMLTIVGEQLRSMKVAKQEPPFTGPVVVVAREPEEQQTRFAIRTVRNGKPCRIESITPAPLDEVLEWMRNKTIIQVSGTVTRHGGSLQINNPTEVAAFTKLPKA